jgi:hypothetical protein
MIKLSYDVIFLEIIYNADRPGRDRMVVGFTTTCAISAYHHKVVSSNPSDGEVY